jgi:hypothetical protein
MSASLPALDGNFERDAIKHIMSYKRTYIIRKLEGKVGVQPCHGRRIIHLRQPAANAVALPLAEWEETF